MIILNLDPLNIIMELQFAGHPWYLLFITIMFRRLLMMRDMQYSTSLFRSNMANIALSSGMMNQQRIGYGLR